MRKHLLSSYSVLRKACQEVLSRGVLHWRGKEAGEVKTSCRHPVGGMKTKASLLTSHSGSLVPHQIILFDLIVPFNLLEVLCRSET